MEISILRTVRDYCNIDPDDSTFDTELLLHINSAFFVLYQLNVGPETPFQIRNESSSWADFMSDIERLESVKLYICVKTKLAFDPPSVSYVADAMQRILSETEWRLNAEEDYGEDSDVLRTSRR